MLHAPRTGPRPPHHRVGLPARAQYEAPAPIGAGACPPLS
ncbi:hypothetical protein SFR_2815 [Streptomyces sp. FR-008]|nr:hypothetical protein SFR_2815 [Streptomyces sp. FR-008]